METIGKPETQIYSVPVLVKSGGTGLPPTGPRSFWAMPISSS